jgi:bacterioferritin
MAKISNAELIEMLAAAARDEHAAIIQYLRHAYLMGEGELACEIEATARDEMRHFWMLSRWIVRLGGEPTIARGFTDFAGAAPTDWMLRDAAAEERAIAMYSDYVARVEDEALRSDLERILADEERHHGEFVHFADKLSAPAPGEPAAPAAPAEPPAALAAPEAEALAWGIQHEYAALLQYLDHSFRIMKDEEVSRQLELQAVNEMQHMGWLSEELAAASSELPLEPHPVTLTPDPRAMLQADIALEHSTAAQYARYLPKLTDPGIKTLVGQIHDHEVYHEDLFTRLLKRMGTTAAAGWTIGSLKKEEE